MARYVLTEIGEKFERPGDYTLIPSYSIKRGPKLKIAFGVAATPLEESVIKVISINYGGIQKLLPIDEDKARYLSKEYISPTLQKAGMRLEADEIIETLMNVMPAVSRRIQFYL